MNCPIKSWGETRLPRRILLYITWTSVTWYKSQKFPADYDPMAASAYATPSLYAMRWSILCLCVDLGEGWYGSSAIEFRTKHPRLDSHFIGGNSNNMCPIKYVSLHTGPFLIGIDFHPISFTFFLHDLSDSVDLECHGGLVCYLR